MKELDVVIESGYEAQVLDDVLASQERRRHLAPLAVSDGVTKQSNGISNALGVMSQHPVEQLVGPSTTAIQPSVEFVVVLRRTTEGIYAADGVIVIVRHQKLYS